MNCAFRRIDRVLLLKRRPRPQGLHAIDALNQAFLKSTVIATLIYSGTKTRKDRKWNAGRASDLKT